MGTCPHGGREGEELHSSCLLCHPGPWLSEAALSVICRCSFGLIPCRPTSPLTSCSLRCVSLLTDTNVIRYIQLTEMKLSRCSQREKEAMWAEHLSRAAPGPGHPSTAWWRAPPWVLVPSPHFLLLLPLTSISTLRAHRRPVDLESGGLPWQCRQPPFSRGSRWKRPGFGGNSHRGLSQVGSALTASTWASTPDKRQSPAGGPSQRRQAWSPRAGPFHCFFTDWSISRQLWWIQEPDRHQKHRLSPQSPRICTLDFCTHTHARSPPPRTLSPCLPPSLVVSFCAFSSPPWGSETLPGFTCHRNPLSMPSGDHTYHSPRLPASRQLWLQKVRVEWAKDWPRRAGGRERWRLGDRALYRLGDWTVDEVKCE